MRGQSALAAQVGRIIVRVVGRLDEARFPVDRHVTLFESVTTNVHDVVDLIWIWMTNHQMHANVQGFERINVFEESANLTCNTFVLHFKVVACCAAGWNGLRNDREGALHLSHARLHDGVFVHRLEAVGHGRDPNRALRLHVVLRPVLHPINLVMRRF